MANRFDRKGGFPELAAIVRKRGKATPAKINASLKCPPRHMPRDHQAREARATGLAAHPGLGVLRAPPPRSRCGLFNGQARENSKDRISSGRLPGLSLYHPAPDRVNPCRFRPPIVQTSLVKLLPDLIPAQVETIRLESSRRPGKRQDIGPQAAVIFDWHPGVSEKEKLPSCLDSRNISQRGGLPWQRTR